MRNLRLNVLAGNVILILIAVSTALSGLYIASFLRERQVSPPLVVMPPPSLYPDFDAIKGSNPDSKIRAVKITAGCPETGCQNDKPATIDFDGIHKRYKVQGVFSRAYLYVEAAVDGGRPLTVWDDFYFLMNGVGGHLIPDENSLPLPPGAISRYLYDLRSISFYPSIKDKESRVKRLNVDLFDLLQDGATIRIDASVSSNRPGRIMREVSVYYECFEGSNCGIEEVVTK